MGPKVTSPMHLTPLAEVLNWSSMMIRPRLSVSTPIFSSPRPLVTGRRPMATRTTTGETVKLKVEAAKGGKEETVSGPRSVSVHGTNRQIEADVVLVAIGPPVVSAPTTLVLSLNLKPCFCKIRWNCLLQGQ
jgi:hypothetical protein